MSGRRLGFTPNKPGLSPETQPAPSGAGRGRPPTAVATEEPPHGEAWQATHTVPVGNVRVDVKLLGPQKPGSHRVRVQFAPNQRPVVGDYPSQSEVTEVPIGQLAQL